MKTRFTRTAAPLALLSFLCLSFLCLSSLVAILAVAANAQESLPTLASAPVSLTPATIFTTFPAKTFIENIVVDKQGTLFVTSLEEGKIYRIGPDGKPQEFAHIAGQVAGIVLTPQGDLFVNGWASDKTPTIWRVTKSGKTTIVATPSGAQFLNGFIPLQGNRYLIADSYLGAIWEFNADTKKTTRWLEHPLLSRSDPKNGNPGVNGLKIYRNVLYASNTQRHLLLRIPLTRDGKPAAPPAIFVRDANLDDFAFDADGNLYATTHIYNSVVRIAPDGKMTTIAAEQGVVGSTSAAFGRGKTGRTFLYVTTNGGMSLPPPGGVQPAKIVRLSVGKTGL